MKKFIWVYAAYLVQTLVLSEIKIFGCSPDIISVVLVILAVSEGYMLSAAIGSFAGVLIDTLSGKLFGMNTLILMYYALSVSLLTDKKSENSPIIVSFIYFVSIAAKESLLAVIKMLLGYSLPIGHLFTNILVKGVFGGICILIIVWWVYRKEISIFFRRKTKEENV
ncbi:MAG: rod shape-determining protein MreD [Clostridia bacterium]|nr:rod shape-determining protein MreD [Clostridia bacterium]